MKTARAPHSVFTSHTNHRLHGNIVGSASVLRFVKTDSKRDGAVAAEGMLTIKNLFITEDFAAAKVQHLSAPTKRLMRFRPLQTFAAAGSATTAKETSCAAKRRLVDLQFTGSRI